MILYEVNLEIDKKIGRSFRDWLDIHVREMLEFDGFSSAAIYDEFKSKDYVNISITYKIDSVDKLKYYIKYNSSQMRQKGIDRFGQKFTATRQIFDGETEINLSDAGAQ